MGACGRPLDRYERYGSGFGRAGFSLIGGWMRWLAAGHSVGLGSPARPELLLTARTHVEILRGMLTTRLTGSGNGDHRDEQPNRRTTAPDRPSFRHHDPPTQQRPVADKARH